VFHSVTGWKFLVAQSVRLCPEPEN